MYDKVLHCWKDMSIKKYRNDAIIKSLRLEKTLWFIKSNCQAHTANMFTFISGPQVPFFEYLNHHFAGLSVPMFYDLSSERIFLICNLNLLQCTLKPFPLILLLVAHEKRLIPIWLHSPFMELERVITSPLSLIFCRPNTPSSLSWSS